jgi:hypothetical protein
LSLLVAAAVVGLVFQLTLPSRLATDDDYHQVAQVLAREARTGDGVLLFPWWTERARLFLPDGLQVVGYLHSETDDLVEHPRVWVLSQPHLPRNDTSGFEKAFLPGRQALGPRRDFGNLSLTLYENGRYRPELVSVARASAKAHVYLEHPDGSRQDCPWDGAAHACPGGARVAGEWHELFYRPHFCLTLHPPGGPTRLVAELDNVPAAETLLVEGGIIWEHAPPLDTTALELGVDQGPGTAELAHLEVPPGVEGMQSRRVSPSPASKTLRIWTQSDRDKDRDACVELRALGPRAGGGA